MSGTGGMSEKEEGGGVGQLAVARAGNITRQYLYGEGEWIAGPRGTLFL